MSNQKEKGDQSDLLPTQKSLNDEPGDVTASWTKLSSIPFCLLGFGILTGWHLLVLFLQFPTSEGALSPESLFQRQLVINLSLAVFFLFFAAISKRVFVQSDVSQTPFLAAGGVMACLGGVGAIYATAQGIEPLLVISITLLGAGEALLSILWLRFYSESTSSSSASYLALSFVMGSAICYLTLNLTVDLALAITAILPLISALMLFLSLQNTEFRAEDEGGRGVADTKTAYPPLIKTTIQLTTYAFVFGMLQGNAAPSESAIFSAATPLAVLGSGLAGIYVTALYLHHPQKANLGIIHRTGFVIFTTGVILVPFVGSIVNEISAPLIMTAYNLFDLVILIFIIDLIRTFDLQSYWIIGINRTCIYGGFAVGMILGSVLNQAYNDHPLYPFVIVGVLIFIIVTMIAFFLDEGSVWNATSYLPLLASKAKDTPEESAASYRSSASPWRQRCRAVCNTYGLSPRESEVFFFIAKGRNAEYIRHSLYISTNTAKTHIANIYKRLNIHSLQEVLDLVDNAVIEDIPSDETDTF
ncbi:MAG: helix-turn-helix transcriptional regulator [Gordonibacter sp.]